VQLHSASFVRLLGALEELASQESMLLAEEDYDGLRRTQDRAAPIVNELARVGSGNVSPALRPRLEALLARRQENLDRLSARIEDVRDALLRTQANQVRVSRIAPAYGRHPAAAPQRHLSARS